MTTHGDPKDRRKRLVEFTPAGVKKFEEAFNLSNDVAGKLFGKLTASELSQLKSASTKLRDAAVAALVKKPVARRWSAP